MVSTPSHYIAHAQEKWFISHGLSSDYNRKWDSKTIQLERFADRKSACNGFGVECIICYCCGWVICVFTVSIRRDPRLCLLWYGGLFISVLSDVACFCPVRTGFAGKMKIVEEPNTFGYEALKYIWYCLATALAVTDWLIFSHYSGWTIPFCLTKADYSQKWIHLRCPVTILRTTQQA